MIITEMNRGKKIDFRLEGYKLILGGEIIIRLDKYQKDHVIEKDIMSNGDGQLVIGAGDYYVAQVVIPATEYTDDKTKKPLDTDNVELKLFSVEGIM